MEHIRATHLLVGLAVLTVGATLFMLFREGIEPRYPTAGSAVVVFGDSLAQGQGATPGHDIASLLEQRLGRTVLNFGASGDTTGDGLKRVDALIAADPRVVVVLLGGNDALRRLPVEETFGNLAALIERIQSVGAAVVLVGEPGGLYGSRYETEYERLSAQYGTFYVSNILHGLIGRTEYMSDAIHPNDAGYALAADRIEPEVRRALAGSGYQN